MKYPSAHDRRLETLTVIEMKGGLGNQLFQFATGLRRVGNRLDALFLNTSYYEHDARHGGFILDKLFKNYNFQLTKAKRFNFPTAFLNFDALADLNPAEALQVSCPVYLAGYFQNHRLIEPVLPYLRELFHANIDGVQTTPLQDKDHSQLLHLQTLDGASIDSTHVIGVHLRRGDYLEKSTASLHGIPRIEDVRNALDREIELVGGVKKVKVVLFTDSKDLVNPFACEVYRSSVKDDKIAADIEEFVAMSRCDTLICSNSSFSYWAGLLSLKVKRHYLPSIWMKSGQVKTENIVSSRNGVLFPVQLD